VLCPTVKQDHDKDDKEVDGARGVLGHP
jgi:hypothetical protein